VRVLDPELKILGNRILDIELNIDRCIAGGIYKNYLIRCDVGCVAKQS
jgi:hypothetical protein